MSKFTVHVLTAVTLVVVFTFASASAHAGHPGGHHARGHHGKKLNFQSHGNFRSHQFHGHNFHQQNFHVNKFHKSFTPKPLVFGFDGHHFGW